MRARRIFRVLSAQRSLRIIGNSRPERLLPEDHVEIGQRDAEADDLAVLLRDRHQLRDHHRLELLGQVVDLVVGHRDEAPVLLPGGVVELLDPLHLALEVLHVERPEGDAHAAAGSARCRAPAARAPGRSAPRCRPGRPRGPWPWRSPARSSSGDVVAGVVRHHQGRRRVEAVHQEAALVVHRERGRARAARRGPRARHQSAAASSSASATAWSSTRLEEAEEADPVAVGLVVQPVADGGDAADDLAVALGEEVLGLGVLEEGVLGRGRAAAPRPDATAGPRAGPARGAGRAGR